MNKVKGLGCSYRAGTFKHLGSLNRRIYISKKCKGVKTELGKHGEKNDELYVLKTKTDTKSNTPKKYKDIVYLHTSRGY